MREGKFLITLTTLLFVPVALGDGFQYEASLGYAETRTDNNGFFEVDTDTTSLNGTYFLNPVDATGVPLAEAAFASRASLISVGYQRRVIKSSAPAARLVPVTLDVSMDSSLFDIISSDVNDFAVSPVPFSLPTPAFPGQNDEENVLFFSAQYITQTGWIAGVDYSSSSESATTAFSTTSFSSAFDRNTLALSFGKYIAPLTVASFSYSVSNDDSERRTEFGLVSFPSGLTFAPINSSFDNDVKTHSYLVSVKSLLPRGVYTHRVQAEVGYDSVDLSFTNTFGENPPISNSDKSYARRWGLEYGFFPTNAVELGVGYQSVDRDFSGSDSYSVSAEWFIKPRIALRLDYTAYETDVPSPDSDTIGLSVRGRY